MDPQVSFLRRARELSVSAPTRMKLLALHAGQGGRVTAGTYHAALDHLGHVAPLAPEWEEMPDGEVLRGLPCAQDLPTSLSYFLDPHVPGALRPDYGPDWAMVKEKFIRRNRRCISCGRTRGDPYWKAIYDQQGRYLGREQAYSRGPQVCHGSNDPRNLELLYAACPQCHGVSERAHRKGAGALTAAVQRRLTLHRAREVLRYIRTEAAEHAQNPLPAIGVGGFDFLVAWTMQKTNIINATGLSLPIPEMLHVGPAELRLCLAAAQVRLDRRGLTAGRLDLLAPLTLPKAVLHTPGDPYRRLVRDGAA